MKRFSKQLSIGLSAAAIVVTLPFIGQPVMASFQQATTTIAQAMQRPQVQLNLMAEKLVAEKLVNGGEKANWQPLKGNVTVNPGDTLRYQVIGQNVGKVAAKKLVVTQPIPQQMTYKLGTASSSNQATATYSIDNGKSFVAQPMVKIKLADGKEVMRPAPAAAYTHVRWQFNQAIDANGQVNASYEFVVR
jgi:uncharacterized repeat protein (TIGR01451 family)